MTIYIRRCLEDTAGPGDLFLEDLRDRHQEDEQEAQVRVRHHVRLFPATEVRRRGKRRLSRRSVGYKVQVYTYIYIYIDGKYKFPLWRFIFNWQISKFTSP